MAENLALYLSGIVGTFAFIWAAARLISFALDRWASSAETRGGTIDSVLPPRQDFED